MPKQATGPNQYVQLTQSQVREIVSQIEAERSRRTGGPQAISKQPLQFARATDDIAAAVDGQLVSGDAQLFTWNPNATSPVAMSSSGLSAITVWNPHDEIIPNNTYLIVGAFLGGYVIIQPLNYCP